MLWILVIVSLAILILGIINEEETTEIVSGLILVCSLIALLSCLMKYNFTKVTADKQITVLEQRNNEVIAQIEPLVKQYLEYESNTFKDLKPSADKVIAISQYPNLKGNEFVQTQIKIILENQKKITDLKLDKVSLNAYKLWIFMGE